MALFRAMANLNVAGQQVVWGREYDLPEIDEVAACVDIGYLLPQLPDGSFAEPAPPVSRPCCGG